MRVFVAYGADIYAEIRIGNSLFGLVTDPAQRADLVFLTRRSILCFSKAVSVAKDSRSSRSLSRVAENSDLVRDIAKFI